MKLFTLLKCFLSVPTMILCFNHVLLVEGFPENLNTAEYTSLEESQIMPRAVASIYRWPKGVVPYTIENNFSKSDMANINQVVGEIQTSSCVRFTPRTNQKDYISIVNYGGCSSSIGNVGGQQFIRLENCGISVARAQFTKALGFELMQKRFDRDNYIYVNLTNVAKGYEYYYAKLSPAGWQLLNTPYDTQSVTHYYATTGQLNTKIPVMMAYDGSKIGGVYGDNFTKTDLLNINRLYNCDSEDCWNSTNCNGGQGPLIWQSGNYGQIVFANGCNFYYADNIAKSTVASHELCAELCLKNLKCTHITWLVSNNVCYLKKGTNPYPLSISADVYPGAVCGYVNIRSPPS